MSIRSSYSKKERRPYYWLVGVVTCSLFHIAYPRSVLADAIASETRGHDDVMPVVVVSAQKRDEAIQEVPLSISVVDAKTLQEDGGRTAAEVTQHVTNTSAATYDGHLRPMWFIRGIGTGDINPNVVQPTGIYFDEVYQSAPLNNGFPLFDLERVEVLKGPQGTLYGKNSTAGAINFISKKPSATGNGYAKLDLASHDSVLWEVAQGGELIKDKLSARVSLHSEQRDSYYTNLYGKSFDNLQDHAGRVQFLWTPDDISDWLLNIHFRDYQDDGGIRFPVGVNAGNTSNFGYPTLSSRDKVEFNAPSDSQLKQVGGSLRYNRDIDGYTLVSITGFERLDYEDQGDADYTPLEIARTRAFNDYRQLSQELRLSSPEGERWSWIVGAHLFHERLDSERARGALPGGAVAALYNNVDFRQKTDSEALFGSVTYQFNERFRLTGGLRYSSERKAIDLARYQATGTANFSDLGRWWKTSSVANLQQNVAQDESHRWNSLGYDLTPQYVFNENVLGYLRVAKGFRAGGYNTSINRQEDTSVVKPEDLLAYELGLKTSWLDGRLLLNAAAFYYDYSDIQVSIATPTATGTVGNLVNGAKGTSQGLELDLLWRPTANLDLNAGFSVLRTEYADFVTPTVDYSGNRFPRAPARTAILGSTYRFDLNGRGSLEATLEGNYRSSFFMFGTNQTNPVYEQGGYTLLNARLSYVSPGREWKVSLYGNNVLDKAYAHHRVIPSNGTYTFAYGAPAVYGVSLVKNW